MQAASVSGRQEILSGKWKPGNYVHFTLRERGKIRPIDAPHINDRQIAQAVISCLFPGLAGRFSALVSRLPALLACHNIFIRSPDSCLVGVRLNYLMLQRREVETVHPKL